MLPATRHSDMTIHAERAMPLHPDLEAFLELANTASPMSEMTPQDARAAYDNATLALDTPGARIPVESLDLPARDGYRLPARIYYGSTTQTALPVLLYFHGGGYVVGGLDSHDSLCRDIAEQAACAVLAIDYRLAPEHKFPTAFQDAEDAHLWLLRHGGEYGLDTGRIAFGGDSVGATLATTLTIAARDAGRLQPLLQLLLYPCTSAAQDTPSHQRYAEGYLLEQRTLQWMFRHALRSEQDRADWRFAPLQAESLAGLAPAHIVLAEYDPLLDEGIAYAQCLKAEGVSVRLDIHDGMVHDFARLGNIVMEADDLRSDLADSLALAFVKSS